jgi:hypothetical protein
MKPHMDVWEIVIDKRQSKFVLAYHPYRYGYCCRDHAQDGQLSVALFIISMRIWLSFFLLLAVICFAVCTEGGDGCLASNPDPMKFQKRMSYAMAVLSTLVYCMPIQPQSFRLVKRARPTGRMRRLLCQTRRFFQRLLWRTMTFRRRKRRVPPRGTCPRSLRRRTSAVYQLHYWFKTGGRGR